MFTLRNASRLAVKAARFSTSTSTRSISTKLPAFRQVNVASKRTAFAPRFTAAFNSSARQQAQSEVDVELVAKLESELELEKEMKDYDDYPISVKDYLESGPFKVKDTAGQDEVVLERKFNDETIRVTFSISDINALQQDELDDKALYDELDDTPENAQSGGAQSKGSAQKQQIEEDEVYDEEGEEAGPSFPARVNVIVEKANAGALQIDGVAQDGMFVIDNVYYHKSAALANAQTAEADWERRGVYAGPPFGNLDEDLQVLLERYLDERGVNTQLALFIPDYIDYKEQKEYMRWLENVKGFVAA